MKYWKKLAFTSLVLALLVQLSGCGFHLRGTGEVGAIPFSSVQLKLEPGINQDFYRSFKRQLAASGIQIIDSGAELQISLGKTEYKTSTTSRSGLGDVSSQLIKMSQKFSVKNIKSDQPLTSGVATAMRDRQVNTSAMTASDTELRTIKKMMTEELARQVIQRITRASVRASNNAATKPE